MTTTNQSSATARRSLVFGLAMGVALTAGITALAKTIRPTEVRGPVALCTQTAPNGKARVTPLAEGENAYLARLELDAHAEVPEHRDSTEEYIHILSGSGTMHIDDQPYAIVPGTTVFMPAGAKVRFKAGPTALSALQVFAGPAPAAKYASWKGCPGAKP